MIKAFIFDLGGVLFVNGTKAFISYLTNTFNLDEKTVSSLLDGELGSKYREGKISREEFWQQFKQQLGVDKDLEDLEDEWIKGYKLIDATRDLILDLIKKYKIYYLSDNVRERVERINNQYNFLELFEDGIFSHEVGVRKPDPLIYQLTLKKLELSASQVIFIDDKEINLNPARDLGIYSILFTTPEDLTHELKKLKLI